MKKLKHAFKYIATGFLVLLVSLCIYTFVVTDLLKKDYVNVFGYTYFVVATGSMSGTIEVDDIIFVKITKDVKVDDIISFKNKDGDIITHRLINLNGDKYITKGDVNNIAAEPIEKSQIIGKVKLTISPSFILKSIAVFLIVFILLTLINFDNIIKKYIVREEKEELPSSDKSNSLGKVLASVQNFVSSKDNNPKVSENVSTSVSNVSSVVLTPSSPVTLVPSSPVVSVETPVVEVPKENVVQNSSLSSSTPISSEVSKPTVSENFNRIPDAIFMNPKNRYEEPSSGLTVTISIDEMEKLNRIHEKEVERDDYMDSFGGDNSNSDENDFFAYEPLKRKNRDTREQEIIDFIVSILKIKKNDMTKAKMNRKWLEKYQYIYKLCHLILNNNIDDLVEEIEKPPFREIYDYDLEKVGLTQSIRNRIYDMPIYVFLRILTYSILYNDDEMFDGVYKIMKYKAMVDRDHEFTQLGKYDSYAYKQVRTLISFMEKVSNKFDNKNVFNLDKIEHMVKIQKY